MLAFLFFATTVNYLDRIVFSVLSPEISQKLHLSDQAYGNINGAFLIAYMIGFIFAGRFIDRFGTRIGYAVAIAWWSVAAACHALARTPFALGLWRAMLGLGESGNFPAAIKSVTEWFPRKDRAFATGIFNAGTNVASMVGPPVFVMMTVRFGWRACFLVTASLGFVWLLFWLRAYRLPENHPGVNQAELEYIRSDRDEKDQEAKISWSQALEHKETWGFALAKFITDPVWWFYLYWLPPYFYKVRGFDLQQIGWALPAVYLMADVGSVAGGWVSGYLIRRGWDHAKARKMAMLLCVTCMPVAATAVLAHSAVLAVALVSLATAGHQGWSANLYTTTSDVFPKKAVASVTGIGGCAGALGGFLFSAVIPGYVITHFGYTPVFLVMGTFHIIGLLVVHGMLGNLRRISMEAAPWPAKPVAH